MLNDPITSSKIIIEIEESGSISRETVELILSNEATTGCSEKQKMHYLLNSITYFLRGDYGTGMRSIIEEAITHGSDILSTTYMTSHKEFYTDLGCMMACKATMNGTTGAYSELLNKALVYNKESVNDVVLSYKLSNAKLSIELDRFQPSNLESLKATTIKTEQAKKAYMEMVREKHELNI